MQWTSRTETVELDSGSSQVDPITLRE